MKPSYLVSVCQSHKEHYEGNITISKNRLLLKKHEVSSLHRFCELILTNSDPSVSLLYGYYVSYSIPQIGNEFDLLRFGTNYIVNIEIKSPLPDDTKLDKIHHQMKKQYYYLKFLGREIKVFTYVENDGFYSYIPSEDSVYITNVNEIIRVLNDQELEVDVDLDKLFKPSNYLVSPFNKVKRFISGEYFLTTDQASKKREILESDHKGDSDFYCISADAGTGKTLLTYDIAKTYIHEGHDILILHCASLNEGQQQLIDEFKWKIRSIGDLRRTDYSSIIGSPHLIVVDEAHRIWKSQLDELIHYAYDNKIKIIFSYDAKQYLKKNEAKNIYEYLLENYPNYVSKLFKLTTKIRTNKRMASFINNMFAIGSSKDNLDYSDITVEYFSNIEDAKQYMSYLCESNSWKAITFTPSQYSREPVDPLTSICDKKAHGVIGQEFERIVFAMDSNFRYNDNNRLAVRSTYYSLRGMLYQIVTRAVNEMKIIVINNPILYEKLLEIKHMGEKDE